MKIFLHYQDWTLTEFVSDNTNMETLQKMFPRAVKIEIDKSFHQLSHGIVRGE